MTISADLHVLNRKRLAEQLRSLGELNGKRAVVVLQGGESTTRYCSDHEPLFRQESFFHWAFGVEEPDFYGAVDVSNGKTYLFAPRLPESYAIWMGKLKPLDFFKKRYAVDEAYWVEDVSL